MKYFSTIYVYLYALCKICTIQRRLQSLRLKNYKLPTHQLQMQITLPILLVR